MEKSTLAWVAGVSAAVAIVALIYVAIQAQPGGPVNKQPPDDPPVTVSDGSLHAHSRGTWLADAGAGSPQTIQPKPANGTLKTNCNGVQVNSKNVQAYLWTDDDKLYDLTPAAGATLKIKIQHDSGGAGGQPYVTISVPPGGQLTITTDQGSFDGDTTYNNRMHSRRGTVESINVTGTAASFNPPNTTGATATWTPPNGDSNPHYTLGFCYQ
jgi:hypothetical protein